MPCHSSCAGLRWRARFGFSEWLSNCYIDEDLLGLVNLYDFAEDAEIRQTAGKFIDMLLFEMALHSYRGVMGCTHGRTYAWHDQGRATRRDGQHIGADAGPGHVQQSQLALCGAACNQQLSLPDDHQRCCCRHAGRDADPRAPQPECRRYARIRLPLRRPGRRHVLLEYSDLLPSRCGPSVTAHVRALSRPPARFRRTHLRPVYRAL